MLNKTDLVTTEELAELEKRIRVMNVIAKIHHTHNAELEIDALLGVKAFDLNRALEIEPDFLSVHVHEHDPSIKSIDLLQNNFVLLWKV